MGYTHYWYRKPETLDEGKFQSASMDCAKVCNALNVSLASWNGKGEPEFTFDEIAFNGIEACGHPADHSLGITWPAPDAKGVSNGFEEVEGEGWFAGATITKRACDGDCSHESFVVTREVEQADYRKDEPYVFTCCKTAFKPYDFAVQCCLIVFAHYFPECFHVHSDGEESEWDEARQACEAVLDYGKNFMLDTEER